jgi:ribosomal protein S18 acetylase RimI-like enzyme
LIRAASFEASEDSEPIWQVLEPVFRGGETYTVAPDISREDALAYWCAAGHEVFVFEENGEILGTYFLRANQCGGGAHIANCGYVTAGHAAGRGIGRKMCERSIEQARARGFRAMQFNFVVSANEHAVRLWESLGFAIVGRLPGAFRHPKIGYVDALVMFRKLD